MTTKQYQPHVTFSTTVVVVPTSKKFLDTARAKKAKGEDYAYWVRAARILHHIDLNIPVGFDRLRRGRKSSRRGGRGDV